MRPPSASCRQRRCPRLPCRFRILVSLFRRCGGSSLLWRVCSTQQASDPSPTHWYVQVLLRWVNHHIAGFIAANPTQKLVPPHYRVADLEYDLVDSVALAVVLHQGDHIPPGHWAKPEYSPLHTPQVRSILTPRSPKHPNDIEARARKRRHHSVDSQLFPRTIRSCASRRPQRPRLCATAPPSVPARSGQARFACDRRRQENWRHLYRDTTRGHRKWPPAAAARVRWSDLQRLPGQDGRGWSRGPARRCRRARGLHVPRLAESAGCRLVRRLVRRVQDGAALAVRGTLCYPFCAALVLFILSCSARYCVVVRSVANIVPVGSLSRTRSPPIVAGTPRTS